jgi:hypothetical protein
MFLAHVDRTGWIEPDWSPVRGVSRVSEAELAPVRETRCPPGKTGWKDKVVKISASLARMDAIFVVEYLTGVPDALRHADRKCPCDSNAPVAAK